MNKRIIVLLLTVAISLGLFTACDVPTAKNAAALREDFQSNEVFIETFGGSYLLNELEILERKTNSKAGSDVVSVRAFITDNMSEDPESEMVLSAVMEYGLYDDGWLLENVSFEEQAWRPLRAPYMDEETISQTVINRFGGEMASFEMTEPTGSVEECSYASEVTCMVKHKYMVETLVLELAWSFDEFNGKWVNSINTVDCVEDWSALRGWYEIHTLEREIRSGFSSFQIGLFSDGTRGATLQEVTYYSAGYSNMWGGGKAWFDEHWDYNYVNFYAIPNTTFANFAIMSDFDREGNEIEEYTLQKGLKVMTDGLSLDDFEYYNNNWLIGKDHIANGLKEVGLDATNRRVVYRFNEVELNYTNLELLETSN